MRARAGVNVEASDRILGPVDERVGVGEREAIVGEVEADESARDEPEEPKGAICGRAGTGSG